MQQTLPLLNPHVSQVVLNAQRAAQALQLVPFVNSASPPMWAAGASSASCAPCAPTQLDDHAFPAVSAHQQIVVDLVAGDTPHNVVVTARAGAGKTTLLAAIVRALMVKRPRIQCLLLTYNAALVAATKIKMIQLGLDLNVRVMTWHQLMGRYTSLGDGPCCNDNLYNERLEELTSGVRLPRADMPFSYDVVMLDECQDMTLRFYRLLRFLTQTLCGGRVGEKRLQYVLVGDPRQLIYGYREADVNYMKCARKLFPSAFPWEDHLELNESFRLTPNLAYVANRFLNYAAKDAIQGVNDTADNLPVQYWVGNLDYDACELAQKTFDWFLRSPAGFSPDKVLILRPFSWVGICYVNALIKLGLPVFEKKDDDGGDSAELRKNKAILMSFPSAKGIQAPIVIVLGADETMCYKPHHVRQETCPNTAYVALTRCSGGRMLVIQDSRRRPMYPLPPATNQLRTVLDEKHVHVWMTSSSTFMPKYILDSQVYGFMSTNSPTKVLQKELELGCVNAVAASNRLQVMVADPPKREVSKIFNFVGAASLSRIMKEHVLHTPMGNQTGLADAAGVMGQLQTVVRFGNSAENVSALYGLMIPMRLEMEYTSRCQALREFLRLVPAKNEAELNQLRSQHGANKTVLLETELDKRFPLAYWAGIHEAHKAILKHFESRTNEIPTGLDLDLGWKQRNNDLWPRFAQLAVAVSCLDAHHHLLRQITHYDWVDVAACNEALERLRRTLPGKGRCAFECGVSSKCEQWYVSGQMDVTTTYPPGPEETSCWELKFRTQEHTTDFLQLATYLCLSTLKSHLTAQGIAPGKVTLEQLRQAEGKMHCLHDGTPVTHMGVLYNYRRNEAHRVQVKHPVKFLEWAARLANNESTEKCKTGPEFVSHVRPHIYLRAATRTGAQAIAPVVLSGVTATDSAAPTWRRADADADCVMHIES